MDLKLRDVQILCGLIESCSGDQRRGLQHNYARGVLREVYARAIKSNNNLEVSTSLTVGSRHTAAA